MGLKLGPVVGLLLAVMLVAGCRGEAAGPAWYPLTEGLQWTYQVTRSDPLGARKVGRLVLTNLGPTTWQTRKVYERRNSLGTHYFEQVREDGVYRLAKRTVVDRMPVADTPPRLILPLPPTRPGSWRVDTATYLLKRIFPFSKPYQHRQAITMEFRVVATDVAVSVPAGAFEGCLRVEGEARIKIASDPKLGMSEVPLKQTEWYCPGTGLVRLVRHEELYTERAAIIGGTLEMVLTDFDD